MRVKETRWSADTLRHSTRATVGSTRLTDNARTYKSFCTISDCILSFGWLLYGSPHFCSGSGPAPGAVHFRRPVHLLHPQSSSLRPPEHAQSPRYSQHHGCGHDNAGQRLEILHPQLLICRERAQAPHYLVVFQVLLPNGCPHLILSRFLMALLPAARQRG